MEDRESQDERAGEHRATQNSAHLCNPAAFGEGRLLSQSLRETHCSEECEHNRCNRPLEVEVEWRRSGYASYTTAERSGEVRLTGPLSCQP